MVGIYEYQCVNWDLGACWNTERGQGSTSVVVVGRNVHDTCMQNARQQHILMHRRGWARQSRMRFGRMFRELKGLKKNERKSRKQKSKHNDKPRTAKNHICTRLIAQMQHINWVKKKANEKQKQCKINAKRRGRIYYTQNHPQDTGRIAKNAQERESNTTNNHKQQKEQKNNHTVFNPEFAEKHKKKYSKSTEHNLILPEVVSTRKVLRVLPKKRKAPKEHGQDALWQCQRGKPERCKKISSPMSYELVF